MSSTLIEHDGIIQRASSKVLEVMLTENRSCASCPAPGACSLNGGNERVVAVANPGGTFAIGDHVRVVLEESANIKSIVLAYVLPFLIFLFTLIMALLFTKKEYVAGIVAVGMLILYYLCLYFLRNYFEKDFVFKLKNS